MTETPPGGSMPPDDPTPPGPSIEPAPDAPPTGARTIDQWIDEHQPRLAATHPYPTQSQLGPSLPERYNPQTSRKMAGWALALSLLLCIPFGFLVAIGLAIAVLVRSRFGGDHGKGMAIAALVISALIIVANIVYLVVLVVGGWDESERDDDGRVVQGGSATLDRLREGDCFSEPNLKDIPDDGSAGEASATVDIVPCSEPHQAEVFAVVDINTDEYPGEAAIKRRLSECYTAFEEYVGIPYQRSRLDFVSYFPTSASWRFGQRTIVCSVVERDLRDVTGSQQNSRR